MLKPSITRELIDMYYNLPVVHVTGVGVFAGGAPPCLLVPRHQAVSQRLEAHCLHQKLILMAARHTPAVAGGTFSRLDSLLFQEGEGVGRGLWSACCQLVGYTLDDSRRVQG